MQKESAFNYGDFLQLQYVYTIKQEILMNTHFNNMHPLTLQYGQMLNKNTLDLAS